MAIGDDAANAGYAVVPEGGEEGKVRYGAREINRTRDYVAVVKTTLDDRLSSKITRGINYPDNADGNDGDIYFKIV